MWPWSRKSKTYRCKLCLGKIIYRENCWWHEEPDSLNCFDNIQKFRHSEDPHEWWGWVCTSKWYMKKTFKKYHYVALEEKEEYKNLPL